MAIDLMHGSAADQGLNPGTENSESRYGCLFLFGIYFMWLVLVYFVCQGVSHPDDAGDSECKGQFWHDPCEYCNKVEKPILDLIGLFGLFGLGYSLYSLIMIAHKGSEGFFRLMLLAAAPTTLFCALVKFRCNKTRTAKQNRDGETEGKSSMV